MEQEIIVVQYLHVSYCFKILLSNTSTFGDLNFSIFF